MHSVFVRKIKPDQPVQGSHALLEEARSGPVTREITSAMSCQRLQKRPVLRQLTDGQHSPIVPPKLLSAFRS